MRTSLSQNQIRAVYQFMRKNPQATEADFNARFGATDESSEKLCNAVLLGLILSCFVLMGMAYVAFLKGIDPDKSMGGGTFLSINETFRFLPPVLLLLVAVWFWNYCLSYKKSE